MRLITKYDDFKSAKTKIKTEGEEKPHQKTDDDIKPRHKTDDTPPQKAAVATIPNWKTY